MPNTINVQIVVNSVLTAQGTTTLFMFDDNLSDSQGQAFNGQGSNELTIHAQIGDTINWNISSIDADFQCVLLNFVATGGQTVLTPTFVNGVWSGTVTGTGTETYHFYFMLNGSPTVYQWDPFISVPAASAVKATPAAHASA